MLPAAWLPDQVVTWPELPHVPSGKLDRAVLRDHLAAPSLEPAADHGGRDVRELTGIQRTVLSVVRTLLGDQSVDVDDDFFLVGGNSLLVSMGFAISLGILISAFVMAMFLVPSVTALLGHAAWWPGHGDEKRPEKVDATV